MIYFASAADAPPGDVTRTYSASTPAKVTPDTKTTQAVNGECAGTNGCPELMYGPRVALQTAFAPAAEPAPGPAAKREAKRNEAPARTDANVALPAPSPRVKSTPVAGPSFAKPRVEQPLAADDAAPALPEQEPAAPPLERVTVEAPEQGARAPQSSLVVGRFQNKASSTYELQRVTCLLDGARVYSGPSAGLAELFRRGLSPGMHQVSVIAEYRGRSSGVFSYTNGFKFTLQGSQRFNVPVGQPAQVLATAYERGGPTEPLAERLALSITTR